MLLKVTVNNKKTYDVYIDKSKTVLDLINAVKNQRPNLELKMINIAGEAVIEKKYNTQLSDYDIDDGETVVITDYYNGGNKILIK